MRFLLKTRSLDPVNGLQTEWYHTLVVDVPQLEKELCSGGSGENGYSITELVGVVGEEKGKSWYS